MESIQITGNKARFDNYLTSPLVVPENAKVCLNKASFSIPVWTQKYISLPNLDAGERAKPMLTVYLNGIENEITWTDFFNAYNTLSAAEVVTEPAFYNGNHKFFLNNRLQLVNNATGESVDIPSFSETLAQALSTQFAFYDFKPNNTMTNGKFVDILGGDIITIANVDYTVNPTDLDTKNFGVVANYAPEKVSALTPVTMNQYWTGADFTRIGDNLTFTGTSASYAIAKDSLSNAWAIDPNGGYWNFRVDLNDDPGYICCGIILTSIESKPDTTSPTFVTANSIEVGIKFSKDGALHTFQAVDGLIKDLTGPGNVDAVQDLYPLDKIFTFDNDVDEWFIQVRRAAGYETGANKFVFRLLHGDINNQGFDNAECFYQSEFTIPSPEILAVPIIYNFHQGGGAGTNEVKDNLIINITADSNDMSSDNTIFSDNSFQIVPTTDGGRTVPAYDFFNAIGLHQTDEDNRWKTSYDSTNLSTSISWSPGSISKKYFVGVDEITKIFDNNINHLRLSNTNGSTEVPRQIEVSISNLAHTPHVGSFAGDVIYTEPDINKVVSYINTDPSYFDIESNAYLEYVYEAFNLVGRRLKNRSKLNINQFSIHLGYKNFLNNLEGVIDAMRGVVKLEFLFDVVEAEI